MATEDLRFNIFIGDDFADTLLRFQQLMDRGRGSVRRFRQEVARNSQTRNALRGLARDLGQVANQSQRVRDAGRAQARQQRQLNEAQRLQLQIVRQLARAEAQRDPRIQQLQARVNATRAAARAEQQLLNAQRLARQGRDEQGRTREQSVQLELIRQQQRLQREVALSENQELQTIRAQTAALRAQNAVRQRQATQAAFQAAGLDTRGQPVQQLTRLQQLQALFNNRLRTSNTQVGFLERGFNRVQGVIGRAVAGLGAFLVIRRVTDLFQQLVGFSLRYQSNIELSTISIGGLVVAVSDLRDANGELVEGSERFANAQQVARRTAGSSSLPICCEIRRVAASRTPETATVVARV